MKAFVLPILLFFVSFPVFGQEITGTVKTRDGKPLENVLVSNGWYDKTNAGGEFQLKGKNDEVFYFITYGYKPLIRVLGDPPVKMEIVLEEEAETDRLRLGECSSKNKGRKLGFDLIVFVPKDAKSTKSRDIDYTNFYIYHGKKEDRARLEGWSGPNATGGKPSSEWIKDSAEINARSIVNEKGFVGFDWTGKTKDGKDWRYIQIYMDSIFYLTDKPEAKTFFDRILDNSCTNLARYAE